MVKIVWPLVAITLVFVGSFLYFYIPELKAISVFMLIGFVVLSFSFLFFFRNELKERLLQKRSRFLFKESITVMLTFFIVGMLNYLVFKNNYHIDITKDRLHTLSSKSQTLVQRLPESKWILFAKSENWNRYRKLLQLYQNENSKIDLEFIDYAVNPGIAKSYNIQDEGTLVIRVGDKEASLVVKDELSITKKVFDLTQEKKVKIGYFTNHGEGNFEGNRPDSFSFLKKKLEESFYELVKVNSIAEATDVSLYLSIDPKTDFTELEVKKLLRDNKPVIILFSPQFNRSPMIELSKYLETFGVEIHEGIILDRLAQTFGQNPSVPTIDVFHPEHNATAKFKGRVSFPLSALFKLQEENATVLAASSPFPGSWGEVSLSEIESGKAKYDDKDFKGPLPLNIVVENENNKLILFGSSGIVSNQLQAFSDNFNYFLNIVDWASNKETISEISRPNLQKNLIYVSELELSLIFYIVILLLPTGYFGVSIFLYRRKLKG